MDEMDDLKDLEGKRVFIELNNGRRYTGDVINFNNNFLKIIDKYKQIIYIASKEINLIQQEPR